MYPVEIPEEAAKTLLGKDDDPVVGLADKSCLTVSIPDSVKAVLPLRIRWHLPEGSHVVKSQVIAHLSRLQGEDETPTADGSNRNGSTYREESAPDASSSCQSKNASHTILIRSPAIGILKHLAVPNGGIVKEYNTPLAYLDSKECDHPLVVRGMCAICMTPLHEEAVLGGTVHAGFVSSQRELRVDKRVLDLDNTLLHATSTPPRTHFTETIVLDDFDRQRGQWHTKRHGVTRYKMRESQGEQSHDRPEEHQELVQEGGKMPLIVAPNCEHPPQSIPVCKPGNSGDTDFVDASSKLGASHRTEFIVGAPPAVITWQAACFPASPQAGTGQRDSQAKVYPHYRVDDEARRIVASLERSIIACRVAGVLDEDSVGPYSSVHASYFKLRPGVINFLRAMSQYFELYLYTMGTATHAQTALRLLDPQRRFFGGRVFSRRDAVQGLKSAHRIFPYDRKMVLVVDDLEYMWHHVASCIKVNGYFFFEDTMAADLRRLTPDNYTQWLSTARPYCNFLHSDLSRNKQQQQVDQACSQKGGQPQRHSECEQAHHNVEAHGGSTGRNESSNVKEESNGSTVAKEDKGASGAAASLLLSSLGNPGSTIGRRVEGSKRVLDMDGFTKPSSIKRGRGLYSQCRAHNFDLEEQAIQSQNRKESTVADEEYCAEKKPSPDAVEGPHAATFFTSTVLRDSDQQLLYLAQILKGIHRLYFKASARLIRAYRMSGRRDSGATGACTSSSDDESEHQDGSDAEVPGKVQSAMRMRNGENDFEPSSSSNHVIQENVQQGANSALGFDLLEHIPDVAWVLQAFREHALKGTHISSTGLQGHHLPRLSKTDLGRMAVRLGARVSDVFDTTCTHLITSKFTDKFARAGKMGIHRCLYLRLAPQPHVMWLEKAIYTWRRPCESAFDFRKCEGVYRSCWEPPEPHDILSDDLYKDVIRRVNRHIKSIQRNTCEKLQALNDVDSSAQLQMVDKERLSGDFSSSSVKEGDKATCGRLTEEERDEWDAFWEEGFGGMEASELSDSEANGQDS